MPASLARSRTAGEASGFSPSGRGAPEWRCAGGGLGAGAGFRRRLGRSSALAASRRRLRAWSRRLRLGRLRPAARLPPPRRRSSRLHIALARHLQPHDRRADRHRVADLGAQPQDLAIDRRGDFDRRLVGHHGGEHRVLAHEVADLDVPFDEFGLGDAFADIGQLDDVFAHPQASHGFEERAADAGRAGEIVPFLRMRIGRVPAGDARHRRFQVVEAVLLHQRRQLGAEAGGQRRLVHDDAAPGLLHRGDDGVEVERQQGAQIDDLGIDAGLLGRRLRDIDHGAIGKHGDAPSPRRRIAALPSGTV